MPKRRRLLMLALSAFTILLAVGGWLLWNGPDTDRTIFNEIEAGMTRKQVDAILQDERSNGLFVAVDVPPDGVNGAKYAIPWYGASSRINIFFDEHNRVVGKELVPAPPNPLLDRLCLWMRLRF